jgi:hypothetical protein
MDFNVVQFMLKGLQKLTVFEAEIASILYPDDVEMRFLNFNPVAG